jgi:hypothetical protein
MKIEKLQLIIVDYFDELIRRIDKKLNEHSLDKNLTHIQTKCLKDTRAEFVNEIKQIVLHNLNSLESKNFLDFLNQKEEVVREKLFDRCCLFVEAKDLKYKTLLTDRNNSVCFGYLIAIEDGYITKEQQFYFRNLLRYLNNEQKIEYDNIFFILNSQAKNVSHL